MKNLPVDDKVKPEKRGATGAAGKGREAVSRRELDMPAARSPEEILQEEFWRERAAVLGRAGEGVAKALDRLRVIERGIGHRLDALLRFECEGDALHASAEEAETRKRMICEINREIDRFNLAREAAKEKFYWLIVTREAMGMRRHSWVEAAYRIPARRSRLPGQD